MFLVGLVVGFPFNPQTVFDLNQGISLDSPDQEHGPNRESGSMLGGWKGIKEQS